MNEVEIPLKLGGIAAIKAELRDLQGQIANAGDADTMTELAQQAGALKDQIKDANEQVAIFATGSKFEAVSNSFGAIKNDLMSLDFEGASQKAAIFATTLASLKPEDLKKAFTDFKGTLKSVGEGFSSLGKTLMANPMFLIAAVIAGIVAIVVILMQKLGYLDPIIEAIGTAFDAVIEIIKQFGESLGIVSGQTEEFTRMQEANVEANKAMETSAVGVITTVNEVGTAFDLAKEGVISKEEALATYNEKLGDTFGAATTLAEAEKLYVAKTEAYIEATMARARAEVFAKKAAEADAAAIIAKTKDQTTAIDKTRDNIKKNSSIINAIPILGGIIVATNELVGGSEETLAQKQKKGVTAKEKSLRKEADMYTEEAKKALETAIKKEKANEISNKSEQKKTDTHKSNSAARIKEAENEAKRLYDIEVKANEARIKKEDEQFDLMNKLTMTQQEQDKLALMQDYDKKFAIAEGNAELEKLLTEQQKKDLADINKKYADEATKKTEEDAAKVKAEEEKKAAALKQAQDLIFNMNATQQEKDMRALEEKYKEEQKIIGDNAAAQLQLAEKFEADKKDIEKKYTLEKIENARKEREAKLTLAADIANGINTVGAAFIKDQKKLEKFNKANALIQIGIDTAKAISSLVAASQSNPANAVTFGAAGIAQFATGIIQIATNVAKAKQILSSGGSGTPSGGGGGGGGDTGGGANVAQQVPQAAQLFGSANTGNVMSAGGGGTNNSSMTVTAVVSETQVTNVQNKINKINKNAEL
jgi:hypothetical protein